jgi:hypothetical protein
VCCETVSIGVCSMMVRPVFKRLVLLLASLSLLLFLYPGTAHAVVREQLGYRCVGDRVIRCLWFNWDETNDRLRAYGVAIDAGDGIDYDVAINQLRLQLVDSNGAWSDIGQPGTVNTSWNTDYDGYWENADDAAGALFSCRDLGRFITVRAYAHFSWTGASTGSENMGSKDLDIPCF